MAWPRRGWDGNLAFYIRTSTLAALEGPRELGMETDSIVGQVGRFLVLSFTVGHLEREAVVLADIPDQIAPECAVVSPSKCRVGDGRDVIVVRIVDRDPGVTVQMWP